MNEHEKQIVMAVFDALLRKPTRELNTFLGSYVIEEMVKLNSKLYYEPYCNAVGIKYEDMTEDDFIDAYGWFSAKYDLSDMEEYE